MNYTELEDKYIIELIQKLDELEQRVFESDLLAGYGVPCDQPLDHTKDEQ